ncbi:MAG: substrate-binding domain-containing protein [Proteobacteria bacterium]|nr:substrate-binding domain-containing protein [Pseudomonadota bacterium]MDA1355980.1 substrate-binding domain-containing protein [Pseudomonadota bacterium]
MLILLRRTFLTFGLLAALAAMFAGPPARAEEPFIIVASTSSTQNSGLFDHILPIFQERSGIEVRVLAVGTGQAVRLAQNGDADVLFVHHKRSEEKFVAEGFGVRRYDVMYNEFVIIGPAADPAGIAGMADAGAALAKIAESQAPFVSRGDDSGTHKRETALWRAAGINDVGQLSPSWYREAGSGMGATLNIAAAMAAYTLADFGTWLNFNNRLSLKIVLHGDPALFNPYGVILVNKDRHPHVKSELGQRFIEWLISPAGQAAINAFTINGERAFTADARADIVSPSE